MKVKTFKMNLIKMCRFFIHFTQDIWQLKAIKTASFNFFNLQIGKTLPHE